MKVYRGSAAAARHYVEADRARADDYYLAEGSGIAQRYTASPDVAVRCEAPLSGDAYEAWVAGLHPESGEPKGRLRHDAQAVRFVEVSVNGPKSWSLAAELHPDISAAYDAAQDAAARQIIGWLAQHVTTRVGPRGGQIQVPVTEIDAVTVRHYTSRAGDPHRHLHLQVNARVFADGRWRGLHTVGVRDSIDAINGIGHAAMMTDQGFRNALAAHGFTLDPGTGEVAELAEFVGAFSARAAQIGRHLDVYETEWRAANPHAEPGSALRQAWDRRAWADARPDKVVPRDGAELTSRWVAELHALGYREQRGPVSVNASPVGRLDRDSAVREVLARLGSRRSGWNAADVRGEVEQLIARANVVTDSAVRLELAEDLTARGVAQCVPLLDRPGVPEHVRALTSRHVLEVEADLTARLAQRSTTPSPSVDPIAATDAEVALDAVQQEVVSTLAGGTDLVVIEGAAGAGKTTTLAAARTAIKQHGGRLRVVTPTQKAARVAARQVGGEASSAAWLAYQHGFRWHECGMWSRLHLGDIDPDTGASYPGPRVDAALGDGDVLLIDEAGMLDQDTARALLIIADEHHARVALVGDRHQLPAVGRGGVLDLAVRQVQPEAHRELDTVHRFTRTAISPDGTMVTVPDEDYAQLSLALRAGDDPGAAFDALLARDQIRIHATDAERLHVLARHAANAHQARMAVVLIADTNEQVSALNDAVRAELVAAGMVDDTRATTGHASRIGSGDRVVTRRNDPTLEVANRDTWTVTAVHRDGSATVMGERGERALPAHYVRQHVELGYASTAHGVQGETSTAAHLVVGEHTSAACAYVGMTRGRSANTAHLVADSVEEARQQWVAVFARDRADLGPAHARQLAAAEAARYATGRPVESVLAELHDVWETQATCVEWLERGVPVRDRLAEVVALRREQAAHLAPAEQRYETATHAAEQAKAAAERSETVIAAQTGQSHETLTGAWNAQLPAARAHARTVLAGSGRLGWKLAAVNRAADELAAWSMTWQPVLADMPTSTRDIAHYATGYLHRPHLHAAFDQYARGQAEQAHPEHEGLLHAAEAAGRELERAWQVLSDTHATQRHQLSRYGRLAYLEDPEQRLGQLDRDITSTESQLADAHARIGQLVSEPAIASRPAEFVTSEHQNWKTNRDTERGATQRAADLRLELAEAAAARERSRHATIHTPYRPPALDRGPSIGF